jgi:oxygen-dependent protoporphyrinogen oxidase
LTNQQARARDFSRGEDANDLTVSVIGGGITGLAAAWQLATTLPQGVRVVLLEADARLGGKLRTGELGGRPVELGADSFLARRDEALALCHELGLGAELISPASNRAYVWARGMLRPLPSGLAMGVPTRMGPLARSGIFSLAGLGRTALDLLLPPVPRRRIAVGHNRTGQAGKTGDTPGAFDVPAAEHASETDEAHDDESVGSVVRRRLGSEVHDRLADPLIGGIHAGPVDTMSAAAVLPALLRADRQPGSLMRALRPMASRPSPARRALSTGGGKARPSGTEDPSPPEEKPVFMTIRGGLQRLVDRLTAALEERGVEIRLGARAEGLDRPAGPSEASRWSIATAQGNVEADGVVVAVPAGAASGLFRKHDPSLAELLDGVPYASLTLVTVRFSRRAVGSSLEGTGFLIPTSKERLLTACTWLSSKWPDLDRPDDVLMRASMGRYGDERSAQMSDDEVAGHTLRELRQMLDLSGEPLETVVTRWPEALPQYLVGHLQRVQAVEQGAARHRGLALAGAALHGVGIPACIGSGRHAAKNLLDGLASNTRLPP